MQGLKIADGNVMSFDPNNALFFHFCEDSRESLWSDVENGGNFVVWTRLKISRSLRIRSGTLASEERMVSLCTKGGEHHYFVGSWTLK